MPFFEYYSDSPTKFRFEDITSSKFDEKVVTQDLKLSSDQIKRLGCARFYPIL